MSRETLLDLEPSDAHTEAVRGGTVPDPSSPSWCEACGPVPPARQTVPPTGDECAPPKQGDRYKFVHTTETEFKYSVVDVYEGEEATISFLLEEVNTKQTQSPAELIPDTP